MRCMIHSERAATGVCHECGRDYCSECLIEIKNSRLCKDCVAHTAPRGYVGPGHGYKHEHTEKKVFNKFLLFVMGVFPGLGYMYLGLIKRGLFTMAAFSATIYLIATISGWFAFPLVAIIFAAFFDGFRLLRLAREGGELHDNIDDILAFVKNNRAAVIAVVLGIIGMEILGSIITNMSGMTPVILIVVGLYFLFVKRRKV